MADQEPSAQRRSGAQRDIKVVLAAVRFENTWPDQIT
jgi:hypothetical protein